LSLLSCVMLLRTPRFTFFPYTTLFRSKRQIHDRRQNLPQHPVLVAMSAILDDVAGIDDEVERILGVKRCDARDHLLPLAVRQRPDRKSTRLNSSHVKISYAVFCLKTKT